MSKKVQLKDSSGNIYPKTRDVYSTSEIKTDKIWIDGKPIYRKTIDCGQLLRNDTAKLIAHNISNIDLITSREAFGYISTGSKMTFNIPFGGNTTNMFDGAYASARVDSTYIYLSVHGDLTSYSAYVTLEYTKTTD